MATDYSGTTAHMRRRRELLAQLEDGQPCPRCGRPMHRWQRLDADHIQHPHALYPHALPDALSHTPCNRYAGVVLREALRGITVTPRDDHLEAVRVQVLAYVTQRVQSRADQQASRPQFEPTRTSRAW